MKCKFYFLVLFPLDRPQPGFQEKGSSDPLSLIFKNMNVLVAPSPLAVTITDKEQKIIQNLIFE
jgi:hypothetical protein